MTQQDKFEKMVILETDLLTHLGDDVIGNNIETLGDKCRTLSDIQSEHSGEIEFKANLF